MDNKYKIIENKKYARDGIRIGIFLDVGTLHIRVEKDLDRKPNMIDKEDMEEIEKDLVDLGKWREYRELNKDLEG